MSFGGRGYGRPRSWGRARGYVVKASSEEAKQVEKDYEIPEKGFCHECEAYVDESAGKLHRPTCKTTPERKRSA